MMTKTYLTPTFSDIFPDTETFIYDLDDAITFVMTEDEKEDLFWLLYAKFGDSHTRFTNTHLFKAALFKRNVNVFYPTLLAVLREQKKLRDTDDEEFSKAGKMVTNIGVHNTANVSTDTTDGIEQLDTQQISNSQRGIMSVIADRLAGMKSGVEEQFLKRLSHLFRQILSPDWDLLYSHDPSILEEE